jgi:hypothetical protein
MHGDFYSVREDLSGLQPNQELTRSQAGTPVSPIWVTGHVTEIGPQAHEVTMSDRLRTFFSRKDQVILANRKISMILDL